MFLSYILCFYFMFYVFILCFYLILMFIRVSAIHQLFRSTTTVVDTRSCTDLHRFQNNFNVGHKSLKVKGAQLWNTLPQHLKERSTINKFKKELRFYLINFSG